MVVQGETQGHRPIQTDVRKSKASVFEVNRSTAEFALTCQSTNPFLPKNRTVTLGFGGKTLQQAFA
jgi:hypothetical protein